MAPSLEREARAKLTVRAQTEAINVFAKNLEGLLSARPVRGARVLALDPGYRTGCKVAVMDETGKLLDHGVVYPTKPRHDVAGTKRELARLVKKDSVNTIVIGNGTASRETEEVVSEFIAEQALSCDTPSSTRPAHRCTPPPSSPARSIPIWTSPCVAP